MDIGRVKRMDRGGGSRACAWHMGREGGGQGAVAVRQDRAWLCFVDCVDMLVFVRGNAQLEERRHIVAAEGSYNAEVLLEERAVVGGGGLPLDCRGPKYEGCRTVPRA